jgi:hypothetical protein
MKEETRRMKIAQRLNLVALVWGACVLGPGVAGGADAGKPDDKRLLNNIDSLKAVRAADKTLAPVEQLSAELAGLWDWKEQGSRPLAVETAYSELKNGYRVEGIYFNGYGDANGQDRVFCCYARPEKIETPIPAFIVLTGGSDPEGTLWLARQFQCAVMGLEWRGTKDEFRSQWAGGQLGSMQEMTSLKSNMAFRLVCGIRRAIDFLSSQPGIDRQRIGCGGGSMGGYFTLLAAGIDDRVSFGMDELGAGHLDDSDSRLGQIDLDPQRKQIWLAAFDPHRYLARTKARLLMNLSANDYFFWLGDGVEDYRRLAGEKRLSISPNFNHNDGAFGARKNSPFDWVKYCVGQEPSFPQIATVKHAETSHTLIPAEGTAVKEVTLYWSPGERIPWPARYWAAVPARQTAGGWQAEVPARYAGVAGTSFMNLTDAKSRTVSSLPQVLSPAGAPQKPGVLWDGEQLWDSAAGAAAWRLIGPNVHPGVDGTVVKLVERNGLSVCPGKTAAGGRFALVSNSFVLAGACARQRRGLRLEVDGNGQPGELTVILVKNFGTIKMQKEYPFKLKYGEKNQEFQIAWAQFGDSLLAGNDPLPFESMRFDGSRPDGTAVTIRVTGFQD